MAGGNVIQLEVPATGYANVGANVDWGNLTRVVFDNPTGGFGGQIDNIVVAAVLVPAAVWLFGSALAGLGWLRRTQAA